MASPLTPASEKALGAVRRRMRWQAAAYGAATLAVAAAATVAVGVYLQTAGAIGERGALVVAALALAWIVAGAVGGALRPLPLRRVAKRVDDSHRFADRFGAALELSQDRSPTPMMRAAIADAETRAPSVRPQLASPWHRPPHLAASAVCVALAVAVHFLHFPVAAPIAPPAPPAVGHLSIDRELLEPERDLAREIRKEALATGDDELKDLSDQLAKLFDQIDKKELTRKELFEKLAELEQKALAGRSDGGWEELKQKLRKAGEEMGKDSLARDAAEAMKKDDLEQARRELEELAKKLEANQVDQREQEKLAKAMEQAAREQKQSPSEEKTEREIEQLAEEQRRLKKDQQQDPNNQDTQRRLQKNERRLSELKRDQQRQQNAQRQLQRLQRQMQSAASQMRSGGGQQQQQQQSAQSMRNAAGELGKMQDEIRKLGNSKAAQGAIAQLREVLRRMPQNGQGAQGQSVTILDGNQQQPGQEGQEGRDGQNQKGQNGQNGQNGQKPGQQGQGARGEKLHDFLTRAGGKSGESDQKIFMPGEGGEGNERLLMPMDQGGNEPGRPGQGDPMPGTGSDGIGSEHDPNLHGAATQLAAKRQLSRVAGKLGAGPSKSETILGSAERGFATANYRRVYGDYTSVVEEVMSKEQVPPGYRYYVKRYFQLIKPRE